MSGAATSDSLLGGRYALGDVIGHGGMAHVHRAHDQVLDRPVAVKLLREVTDDPADRARFTAEARTLAQLSHPGLVTVLDAGTADDRPYLVMELIEGRSLAAAIAGGALDPASVAAVGAQLADALGYVHSRGIVHRDVKPGNALLTDDGRALLTDFGIARLLEGAARHTATGFTIGTAAYLAPEQVRGAQLTTAADVYALGLVLLEALTGTRAYPGPPTEAALARLSRPPELPKGLPAAWRELLGAMTALEQADRPALDQVAGTLRDLVASTPAHATIVVSTLTGTGDGTAPTRTLTAPDSETVAAPAVARLLRNGELPARARRAVNRARHLPPALVVAALAAVSVLVVLLATVVGGPDPAGTSDVPANVPPAVSDDLQRLHDAVNG